MGLFGSDTPDERVQNLVDNAKHESVSIDVLSKKKASGWGSHNYLNDAPLIEHLNPEEQPHFIYAIADAGGNGVFVENGDDLLPNGKLRTNVAVTDQRILIVIGDKNGDKAISIGYSEIAKIELNIADNQKELAIGTGNDVYNIQQSTGKYDKIPETIEYIAGLTDEIADIKINRPEMTFEQGSIVKTKNANQDIDSEGNDNHSTDKSVSERKFELTAEIKKYGGAFEDNSNNSGSVVFREENLIIDGNEEIAYADLCHMRSYDYYHYNYKERTSTLVNKYQFGKIKGAALRFKVNGGGLLYILKILPIQTRLQ